jgi:uncharacterized protein (DUF885 family)
MKIKKLFCLAMSFTLIFTGCSKTNPPKDDKKIKESLPAFEEYCEEIFIEMATCDALTMNYIISDISNFNIEKLPEMMIEFDSSDIETDMDEIKEIRTTLKKYDYDELNEDLQITYDSLEYYLDCCEMLHGLELYQEPLGPTIGIQAELPSTLSEFTFYTKDDIDIYLNALPSIYTLFEEIMKFEEMKSEAGLFMTDTNADAIIKQCKDFIANPETNLLISSFNKDIDKYPGLSQKEKDDYKKKNKEIVLTNIIPAYELIICKLDELKGTGCNTKGLCFYEDGKEYYEYLVRSNVGTSEDIYSIIANLEHNIDTELTKLLAMANTDKDLFKSIQNANIEDATPAQMMEKLKAACKEDYPNIGKLTYDIKSIDKSLEEHLSPAFYFKPPVDSTDKNVIYINESKLSNNLETFVTLAHEGLPGHMYHFNYNKKIDYHPLRQCLEIKGVSEGWAKHSEYYSYNYAGFEPNTATGLAINSRISLCIEARAEIGINYEGWTVDEVYEYISQYFSVDEDVAKLVYDSALELPANTLSYAYGELLYNEMENTAADELEGDFNRLDFNTFILEIGFAPFDVIINEFENEYLD